MEMPAGERALVPRALCLAEKVGQRLARIVRDGKVVDNGSRGTFLFAICRATRANEVKNFRESTKFLEPEANRREAGTKKSVVPRTTKNHAIIILLSTLLFCIKRVLSRMKPAATMRRVEGISPSLRDKRNSQGKYKEEAARHFETKIETLDPSSLSNSK